MNKPDDIPMAQWNRTINQIPLCAYKHGLVERNWRRTPALYDKIARLITDEQLMACRNMGPRTVDIFRRAFGYGAEAMRSWEV